MSAPAARVSLASLGQVAVTVTHEINNPIAYVTANLSFVHDALKQLSPTVPIAAPDLEELRGVIEECRAGLARIKQIVSDVKGLSHQTEGRAPVDIQSLLQSTARIANPALREHARLVIDLQEVPAVIGNASQLGQVVLNLLVNAAQAIPAGNPSKNQVKLSASATKDRIRIAVQDSGSGMPPEVRARLFEPFFTTKPSGVGTGLGLPVCKSIVTAHGGSIQIESTVGRGSTFTIELPLAEPEAPASTDTARPSSFPRLRLAETL